MTYVKTARQALNLLTYDKRGCRMILVAVQGSTNTKSVPGLDNFVLALA